MKEKQFINLINLFLNKDNKQALNLLEEISSDFDKLGNKKISKDINNIISQHRKVNFNILNNGLSHQFILSEHLKEQIQILINNIGKDANKILFYGDPGTGKTELAKKLSDILNLDLKIINYNELIDSKLGATTKNIEDLFYKYNGSNVILFFDEIDGISTNRINYNDIYEMSRVTTTFLKLLDHIDSRTIFIASTNLINQLDKAFLRRMDISINFNTYSKSDIENIIDYYAEFFSLLEEDVKTLRIINNDINIKLLPYDVYHILKTIKMRKNANFSFAKVYKEFLMTRLNLDESQLINYLIKNKNYIIESVEFILNKSKLKKQSIANKRKENNI